MQERERERERDYLRQVMLELHTSVGSAFFPALQKNNDANLVVYSFVESVVHLCTALHKACYSCVQLCINGAVQFPCRRPRHSTASTSDHITIDHWLSFLVTSPKCSADLMNFSLACGKIIHTLDSTSLLQFN